jgi:hypothetical protein
MGGLLMGCPEDDWGQPIIIFIGIFGAPQAALPEVLTAPK